MIYGTQIPEDESARAGLLDRTHVPWNVALENSAKDAWVHNPISEGFDALSTFYAQHPESRFGYGGAGGVDPVAPNVAPSPADEFVDPKTLNSQYGESLGLSFDTPMRKGAVDIIVRRKREEIERNAYLDRAPGGLAYGIANFATQLGVSAVDPLNVASAFLPVISEARAGLWAERYGRTAARLMEGAASGALGAATVEPVVYGSEKYLHGDYDLMDSLLNVAVGGVLGGGLHAGLGALGDRLGRLSGETREGALRGAVAQMAEGRDVEVGHIILSDPTYREASFLPIVNEADFRALSEHAQANDRLAQIETELKGLPADNTAALDLHARLSSVEDQLKSEDLTPEARRILATRRDEILTNTTPERLREQVQPTEQRRALTNEQEQLRQRVDQIQAERVRTAADQKLAPPILESKAAQALNDLQALKMQPQIEPRVAMAQAQQAQAAVRADAAATLRQATDQARTNTVAAARGDRVSSAASIEAAANAERTVKEGLGDDIAAELDEAMARLADFERQGALSPEQVAETQTARDLIQRAQKEGKAAEAAARCLLLHP